MRTGKRSSWWRWSSSFPVHPRAYGEELSLGLRHATLIRFTPVRTGKRLTLAATCPPLTVHPRAYGEESVSAEDRINSIGSPPCVRGRVRIRCDAIRGQRFTPVRTGKRTPAVGSTHRAAVHPRAYGEESWYSRSIVQPAGSPPCVRGRDPGRLGRWRRCRFTPVRTGKRNATLAVDVENTVHPRAYGEELQVCVNVRSSVGSPPCVRGRGWVRMLLLQGRRFTPVRTGKRQRQHGERCRVAVHPRAYGEENSNAA